MDIMSRAQEIVQGESHDCTGYPCEAIQRNAVARAKLESANAAQSHEIAKLSERLRACEVKIGA